MSSLFSSFHLEFDLDFLVRPSSYTIETDETQKQQKEDVTGEKYTKYRHADIMTFGRNKQNKIMQFH